MSGPASSPLTLASAGRSPGPGPGGLCSSSPHLQDRAPLRTLPWAPDLFLDSLLCRSGVMLPSQECYKGGLLSPHPPNPPAALLVPAPPTQPRRQRQNTEFFLKDTGTPQSLFPFLWKIAKKKKSVTSACHPEAHLLRHDRMCLPSGGGPLSAHESELGQLYDPLRPREHQQRGCEEKLESACCF